MTINPLAVKLAKFVDLSPAEIGVLDSWIRKAVNIRARRTVVEHDNHRGRVCIVLSGCAVRYKDAKSGKRQIVGLMLPGDSCDMHALMLRQLDYGVMAVSDTTVVLMPRDDVAAALEAHPALRWAFWGASLADARTTKEWLLNLGRREAAQRVAHFFCELHLRLHRLGLKDVDGYPLAMCQADLADATGLTAVHINRVLRALREDGLIAIRGRRFSIPDVRQLALFCGFDAGYLLIPRVEGADHWGGLEAPSVPVR